MYSTACVCKPVVEVLNRPATYKKLMVRPEWLLAQWILVFADVLDCVHRRSTVDDFRKVGAIEIK